MKFTVEHKAIKAALATAMLAVGTAHRQIPIMSCVLITAKDAALKVTGSCLDIEAHGKCEAAVSDAGSVAVDAAALSAMIGTCHAGSLVDFATDGDGLTIRAGRQTATLACMDAREFPRMAKPGAGTEITEWARALLFCQHAISKEEARYYLRGVLIADGMAVATDGHRLACMPVQYDGPAGIIPAAAVPSILKVGGRLFVSERTWRAETDGAAMAGVLVDGTYPDWKRVLPPDDTWATCDADALLASINAVLIGEAPRVTLDVSGPDLIVSSEGFNATVHRASGAIACEGIDGRNTCISPKYAVAALSVMAGRVVRLTGIADACGIASDGFDGRLVIMGMRRDPAMSVAA